MLFWAKVFVTDGVPQPRNSSVSLENNLFFFTTLSFKNYLLYVSHGIVHRVAL